MRFANPLHANLAAVLARESALARGEAPAPAPRATMHPGGPCTGAGCERCAEEAAHHAACAELRAWRCPRCGAGAADWKGTDEAPREIVCSNGCQLAIVPGAGQR